MIKWSYRVQSLGGPEASVMLLWWRERSAGPRREVGRPWDRYKTTRTDYLAVSLGDPASRRVPPPATEYCDYIYPVRDYSIYLDLLIS